MRNKRKVKVKKEHIGVPSTQSEYAKSLYSSDELKEPINLSEILYEYPFGYSEWNLTKRREEEGELTNNTWSVNRCADTIENEDLEQVINTTTYSVSLPGSRYLFHLNSGETELLRIDQHKPELRLDIPLTQVTLPAALWEELKHIIPLLRQDI